MLDFVLCLPLLLAPAVAGVFPVTLPGTLSGDGPEISVPAGGSVRLWVGKRQVVAIEAADPAAEDREWMVTSNAPGVLEPLGLATILGGERYGSCTVRVLEAGAGELCVGEACIRFDARISPLVPAGRRAALVFVAPAEGAVLSGVCAIGVELPARPGAELHEADPVLEVPGVGDVFPTARVAVGRGPEQRWVFEVDTAEMSEGPHLLRVRLGPSSREGEPAEGEAAGKPLFVRVVHGDAASQVLAVEAEAALGVPRPETFGERRPSVVGDPEASGGTAVVIRGYQPAVLFHLDVPEAGRWQVIARVRGRIGGGAFPSISVSVDTDQPRLGTARVVSEDWHRLAVGLPLELEAGVRLLSLRLVNPINEGRTEERHLYLDSVELVSVPPSAAPVSSMMSMESMVMAEAPSMMDAGATTGAGAVMAEGLWVGFQEVFDGLPMNGDLRVEGKATWRGGPSVPAPRVALLIDGKPVSVVQGSEPVFDMTRDELGPGAHTVQLSAEQAGGRLAVTPVQTIHVRGRTGVKRPPLVHRYGMQDDGWATDQSLRQPSGPVSASFDLPEALEGRYAVRLDARGPGTPNHGLVSVRIEGAPDEKGDRPVLAETSLEVNNWWYERPLGEMDLPAGAKRLSIDAVPQPDGAASEQPQLFLRSVVFERLEDREGVDYSPPGVELLYPEEGATVDAALDAVVADVFDDRDVQSAELLVDGRSVAAFARVPSGAGYAVLPLVARDLDAGEHRLSVQVFDRAGNESESAARTVTVPVTGEVLVPGRFARAVHLLNRMGFGPDPHELAEVLVHGERAWIDGQMTESPGHRVARGRARTELGAGIPYGAAQLTLQIALSTDQPLRERFALFLDNHFNTWGGKTGMPSEWGDHLRYQDAGLAPFGELLRTAISSPVMLVYLDQQKSFRGRLNENLARELLELHTVGVNGGYGQDDVTALAGLLCGLTVGEEAPPDGGAQYLSRVFRFAPDLADSSAQRVFGAHFGEADGEGAAFDRFGRVLEHLSAHPMTARFWARKLAEHFVAVPAPEALVEDLAECFLATGGDTRELLLHIAEHPSFWAAMDTPRVASPLDFGLRFGRATTPRHLHGQVDALLRSAGMGMFDHAAPDGYPEEDEAWIDSNGLLARWRLAQGVSWAARVLTPDPLRRSEHGDSFDEFSSRAIDHASFRLLGRLLGPDSMEAAVSYMREISEEPAWKRVEQMCVLLTRFPEANLR